MERKTDHHIFGHRVEDRCCGLSGYPGGAVGVSENELSGEYRVGATITGTDGMMDVQGNSLKYMTPSKAGWQKFEPTESNIAGFGKASGEIMMAVYESARVHERVMLPLQTRDNPLDVAVEEGRIPVERPGFWDERSFLVRGESMSWTAK